MINDKPPSGAIIPMKEYLNIDIKYSEPEKNTIPVIIRYPETLRSRPKTLIIFQ